MLKGKTESGFEYAIDKNYLDNFELAEALVDMEENELAAVKVVRYLLGEEQKKKLLEHIRNEKGIATITLISKELADIFEGIKELKNS
jgi:hypothetical protein